MSSTKKILLGIFIFFIFIIGTHILLDKYIVYRNIQSIRETASKLGLMDEDILVEKKVIESIGLLPKHDYMIIYKTDQHFEPFKQKVAPLSFRSNNYGNQQERQITNDFISALNDGQYAPEYSDFSMGPYFEKDLQDLIVSQPEKYEELSPKMTGWEKNGSMNIYLTLGEPNNAGDKFRYKGTEIDENLVIINSYWHICFILTNPFCLVNLRDGQSNYYDQFNN